MFRKANTLHLFSNCGLKQRQPQPNLTRLIFFKLWYESFLNLFCKLSSCSQKPSSLLPDLEFFCVRVYTAVTGEGCRNSILKNIQFTAFAGPCDSRILREKIDEKQKLRVELLCKLKFQDFLCTKVGSIQFRVVRFNQNCWVRRMVNNDWDSSGRVITELVCNFQSTCFRSRLDHLNLHANHLEFVIRFVKNWIKNLRIMRLAGIHIVYQLITVHLVTGLWVGLRPTKATLDSAKFVFFHG